MICLFFDFGGFAALATINSIALSKSISSKDNDLGNVALILLYSTYGPNLPDLAMTFPFPSGWSPSTFPSLSLFSPIKTTAWLRPMLITVSSAGILIKFISYFKYGPYLPIPAEISCPVSGCLPINRGNDKNEI